MLVYFIRHGESFSNSNRLHQGPNDELTTQGKAQARRVARRLKGLPFGAIISSSFLRAKQTAQIIAKGRNLSISYTPLIVEQRRPSGLVGKSFDMPETKIIQDQIKKGRPNPHFRHLDEETYAELFSRVHTFVQGLQIQHTKFSHLLVVSHGTTLRMTVYCLMFPEFNPNFYHPFADLLDTKNTGVTIAKFKPESSEWKLICWNDHSHLPQ